MRGWLNAKPTTDFAERCVDVWETYRLSPARAQTGIETLSLDEMPGILALERAAQIGARFAGRPGCAPSWSRPGGPTPRPWPLTTGTLGLLRTVRAIGTAVGGE